LRQTEPTVNSKTKKSLPQIDLKSLNLDFINSLSREIYEKKTFANQGKMNFNIMIGNNNVRVSNQNLRNNRAFGKIAGTA
jgi:hypothetical protein